MRHTILKRETLFQGYFRLDRYHVQHEKFDGGSLSYMREVFQTGRGVAGVLLFDPQQDSVVMVEQFRAGMLPRSEHHGEHPWMTEIVLGRMDADESPEVSARREAVEETGCEVLELQPIARFYSSPGSTSEYIHLFAGRTVAPKSGEFHGVPHEHEDIRVHVMDAAKAIGMLYANKVQDAQTMVALQWFAMHHTELRSRWLMSDVGSPLI